MNGFSIKPPQKQEINNRTLRLPIKGPIDVLTSDGGLAIHCRLDNGTPVVIIPHGDCLAEFAIAFAQTSTLPEMSWRKADMGVAQGCALGGALSGVC
jgi:hypothetical protein